MSPDVATALRVHTPAAPDSLRERVAAITITPPAPPRFTLGRALRIAVPAVAGLSLAAALAVGLSSGIKNPTPPTSSAGAGRERAVERGPLDANTPSAATADALPRGSAEKAPAGPLSTARGRAQDVNSTLTLLVDGTDDLSDTTQRALRIARRLGGYVVGVQYATPKPGEGTAAVRLRIPVSRVQAAVVQLNGLGQILAQQTQITDAQERLDDLTRRIRQARGDRTRIAALRRERTAISRRAAFATVDLNLTTHAPREPNVAPGRLDRAVHDAGDVLAVELAIAAYALIVASPLLLLFLAAFFGNRAYRRLADQRLLERA